MTNLLLVTTLVSLLSSATALLSSSCSGTRTSGSYEVSWEVIDDSISYVMFNVSADTTGWVAVGFSLNRVMPQTDVVVGGANDEGDFVDDRYASARAQPPIDDSQDIMNYTASLVGGRQMISFVRAIDTGDSDDLSLDQCVYFLWAYGGSITGVGPPAVIGQHANTARGVFNEQVCLNMCEEIITDPPPVEVACSGCTSTDNGLFTYCWSRRGEFVDFNATAQTELWVGLGVSMDRMMADTDVVIGAINPDDLTQYFLQDRYATARMLPPLDERQDISVLSVTTNDGYTTISFTRHVDTGDDEDDIDLTMCRYILWAYGGMVDFDTPGPSSPHTPTTRGVFTEQLCLPNITSCPVPHYCSDCVSNSDGTYTYCWTRYGDYVHFTVSAETDLWVGFGVSNNRMMAETDVVIGATNPGDVTQFFVQDRYAIQQALPPLDESDDLMGVSATIENGYAIIRFTRLIDTGDDEDDIDLTTCRYILWAYGGTVEFDTPGPSGPHARTTRGVFSEQLCLPSFALCPGPTVAIPTERGGAAMISVSIATLLVALLAAILY